MEVVKLKPQLVNNFVLPCPEPRAVSYSPKCPFPPRLSLTAPVTAALASLPTHFLTEGASHFAT